MYGFLSLITFILDVSGALKKKDGVVQKKNQYGETKSRNSLRLVY